MQNRAGKGLAGSSIEWCPKDHIKNPTISAHRFFFFFLRGFEPPKNSFCKYLAEFRFLWKNTSQELFLGKFPNEWLFQHLAQTLFFQYANFFHFRHSTHNILSKYLKFYPKCLKNSVIIFPKFLKYFHEVFVPNFSKFLTTFHEVFVQSFQNS